jgi:Flp pilus assembly protein protease CpaA
VKSGSGIVAAMLMTQLNRTYSATEYPDPVQARSRGRRLPSHSPDTFPTASAASGCTSLASQTIGVFTCVYFALLNTAIPVVIFVAIILSFIPHDIAYGPQAALIAECFPARLRYSGSSLGFHLASIIAGGPAPLIATALLAWTGSGYSVALYVLLSCVISIAATIPLPDFTNRDISEEPIYEPSEGAVLAKVSPGR